MSIEQGSQKRKASSAEINPQPAQKLKITMKNHAANDDAREQADQVDAAISLEVPTTESRMRQRSTRSKTLQQDKKISQLTGVEQPREYQFVNTFGPSGRNAFHSGTAATVPGPIYDASTAYVSQPSLAASGAAGVLQTTLNTGIGGSGNDSSHAQPSVRQLSISAIPVPRKILNDVLDENLRLVSIVGRVVFKEDGSRTYYYLINFNNEKCAWHWSNEPRMTKAQRKSFSTLIAQFDKAYPKTLRIEEKITNPGDQIDGNHGTKGKGANDGRKIATGGKIKKENLPKAAIRPPPGYPACSFSWKEKILTWFGYNGFHDVEEDREEQAKTATESTQDVDEGIRCYDAAFFAEAIKPQPGTKLKHKPKENWDVVSEDDMDTEEKRFQAAASNGGLNRSDRRRKFVASPLKAQPGALPARLTMGTNALSESSKKEVKATRGGQRALASQATIGRHTRLEQVAEPPDASKAADMGSGRNLTVTSENNLTHIPQKPYGNGKTAAPAKKAIAKRDAGAPPDQVTTFLQHGLSQVSHSQVTSVQSKQLRPVAQTFTDDRPELGSTNRSSLMRERVAATNASVSEMLPSKRKLAPKPKKPIVDATKAVAGPREAPLGAQNITAEEPQADLKRVPRSSADVTCFGDPAQDVNDPRQKSAPRIIMRCTRSAVDAPNAGWSNLTQRTTTNVFPPTMEFHPGGSNIHWANLSLREVGAVLYLIGWAETSVSGVRNEHRQFVQHGDIIRMVGRNELSRFEKTKTATRRNDLAFNHVRDFDTHDEGDKRKRDTWDAGYATEQRLRLMGFLDNLSATINNNNVVQVHGRDDNHSDIPKAVMSSAEVAYFGSLHELREQARKRLETVDREFGMATKHLLAGHQLPTQKRYDEVTSLELLDYSGMDLTREEPCLLDGSVTRDPAEAEPMSRTEQEPLDQGERPKDFLSHQLPHSMQKESSLWELVDGVHEGLALQAKLPRSSPIPLAAAGSTLKVANGRRTRSTRQLNNEHDQRPHLQLAMSSKRTRENYESDADEDSDEDVISFKERIPVAKKPRRSPENAPPASPAPRPHVMVKASAQNHNCGEGHQQRISMTDMDVEVAGQPQPMSGFLQARQVVDVRPAATREAFRIEISDDEDEEL